MMVFLISERRTITYEIAVYESIFVGGGEGGVKILFFIMEAGGVKRKK